MNNRLYTDLKYECHEPLTCCSIGPLVYDNAIGSDNKEVNRETERVELQIWTKK